MNPYAANFAVDLLKTKAKATDTSSDAPSTATASSEIAAMEAKCKGLQELLKSRDQEIACLNKALEDSKATIKTLQDESMTKMEVAAETSEANGEQANVSQEAAKQRLRRTCTRKADGSLAVPEAIHEQWKAGGTAREKLLRVFISNNFDRDAFVRQITHETKESREVKVHVSGDYYSEEEMSSDLKLSRPHGYTKVQLVQYRTIRLHMLNVYLPCIGHESRRSRHGVPEIQPSCGQVLQTSLCMHADIGL